MRTFLRLLSLVVATVLLSACGQQDEVASPLGMDEVVVHLSAGDAAASGSRSVFTESKPVTVFVYQRDDNDQNTAQYAKVYKRAEGRVTTTASGSNGDLSTVSFDGGNLTVDGGHTYDFVLVVDLPKSATVSGGMISDIPNDADIMVGRADGCYAPKNAYSITVSFDKGYASDNGGNLPHLGSRVIVNASADSNLLSDDGGSTITPVYMGVLSAEFHGVQEKASFNFGSTPMVGLTLTGKSDCSFKLENSDLFTNNIVDKTKLTLISSTSDKATYKGTLLPVPLASGSSMNKMDIDFTVAIGDNQKPQKVATTLFSAKSVELPAFEPGYQYTLNLVINGKDSSDPIKLYLGIEPWNSVSWYNGMGSDNAAQRLLSLTVGSWSTTEWSNGMGGE